MTMEEFLREYGRRGGSIIIGQAVAASAHGENLDTDTQLDLLKLADALEKLLSSQK